MNTENVDISIYGNLILDHTYCVRDYVHGASNTCENKHTSPGAIANVVDALIRVDRDLSLNVISRVGDDTPGRYIKKWFTAFNKLNCTKVNLHLKETLSSTSEAVIISDLKNQNRSSVIQWGACAEIDELKDFNSKWCHIMYLDKLPHLSLKDLNRLSTNSIISIDLCSSTHTAATRQKIFSMLPYVDYVFASFEEASSLVGCETEYEAAIQLAKAARGWAIIHTPKGSIFSNGVRDNTQRIDIKNIVKKPVNVLGAGDNFAAAFIATTLLAQNREFNTIKANVNFAHQQATEYIKHNMREKER